MAKLDAGSAKPHQQPIPPSGRRRQPYQNEKETTEMEVSGLVRQLVLLDFPV
jgi:hypothetical protein